MRIVVVHDGSKEHALALTSIFKPLRKLYGHDTDIHVLPSEDNRVFFEYLPNQHTAVLGVEASYKHVGKEVDLLIDYGGSDLAVQEAEKIGAKKYRGLLRRADSEVDEHAFRGLYLGEDVKRNIFQLLFGVAGLKWKGEGYGFQYYPRTRSKEGRVGSAIKDERVRKYLRSQYQEESEDSRLWHVPIRQNVFKQFDEVNLCDSIVTDDPFVMHVAVCLRKHVEYLFYDPPTIRPEFFNRGCIHLVPNEIKGPDTYDI